MKLLLDIGNTRIKWGFLIDGRVLEPGEILHRDRTIGDALCFIENMTRTPGEVLAANVAGKSAAKAVAAAVDRKFRLAVNFAATGKAQGRLHNGYRYYRQLGVDRWLAMVAACQVHSGPLCVVDAGTATTVDLIDSAGRHLGGLIAPGLDLMEQSLHRDTGEIQMWAAQSDAGVVGHVPDDVQGAVHGQWPARDTKAATRQGGLAATTGLIEQSMRWLQDHSGCGRLVATGGSYQYLESCLHQSIALQALTDGPIEYRPLLVLEGLAIVGA